MAERRRYLVLDAFAPRVPDQEWIQPGHYCDGLPASEILPTMTPWVRLIHPTQSDTTALVLKHLLA